MSDREARGLRKALSSVQSRQSGTSRRYPAELRRQVLGYVGRRLRQGESLTSLARQLGVRVQCLAYWQSKSSGLPRRRFRAVKVTPAAVVEDKALSAGQLVLVTTSGIRVEGLDVSGAASLVRELA